MSDWVINPEEVVRLIPNIGAGIVSLSIMRGDAPVGLMRRDKPQSSEDSGWSFTGLGDTQEFLDDPDNSVVCDLNTVANIDTGIITHLNRPEGVVLVRDGAEDPLAVVEGPEDPPSVVFLPPVSGPARLSSGWSMTVPGYCLRRVDDGSLVIWRPGLTFWLAIMDGDFDVADRIASLRGEVLAGASFEIIEYDGWVGFSQREVQDDGSPSIRFQGISARQHLMIVAYFDDAETEADVRSAFGSVEWLGG